MKEGIMQEIARIKGMEEDEEVVEENASPVATPDILLVNVPMDELVEDVTEVVMVEGVVETLNVISVEDLVTWLVTAQRSVAVVDKNVSNVEKSGTSHEIALTSRKIRSGATPARKQATSVVIVHRTI